MNDLRRPGVLPFLLAEAVLYGTFLWRDLSPGGPGPTPVPYTHPTLPAGEPVHVSVVGRSVKKKLRVKQRP